MSHSNAKPFVVETVGAVAKIVLSKPPLNLLDVPFMLELASAVRRLTQGQESLKSSPAGAGRTSSPTATGPVGDLRAIVLTSSIPGQFCHGIDPKAVLSTDVHGRKAVFLALAEMVEAFWFGYVPLVADISGPALAGGAVLAALADFALIDSDAGKICFSEPKVGLPIPKFVQRLVEKKVTASAMTELMLIGRNVDAAEALRIGLANAAYSGDTQRTEAVQGVVSRVTRLAPRVLREQLRQTRLGEHRWLDEFRADLAGFSDFLTDEFLGFGLAAIVRGESPRF